MNSRERVLAALHLKEPDRVPFADYVDIIVKQQIMGTEEIGGAEFVKNIFETISSPILLSCG